MKQPSIICVRPIMIGRPTKGRSLVATRKDNDNAVAFYSYLCRAYCILRYILYFCRIYLAPSDISCDCCHFCQTDLAADTTGCAGHRP